MQGSVVSYQHHGYQSHGRDGGHDRGSTRTRMNSKTTPRRPSRAQDLEDRPLPRPGAWGVEYRVAFQGGRRVSRCTLIPLVQ